MEHSSVFFSSSNYMLQVRMLILLIGFLWSFCVLSQSKNERFAVLFAQPLSGGGVARLEVYADEKAFNKKKSPKNVLLIKDIEKCEKTEPNNSPSSKDLHRFVLNFKNGDQYAYNCATADQQSAWCSWLDEFVKGLPDVSRFNFRKFQRNPPIRGFLLQTLSKFLLFCCALPRLAVRTLLHITHSSLCSLQHEAHHIVCASSSAAAM